MRAWLRRSDLTSLMISSFSFLYLRSWLGESDWFLSLFSILALFLSLLAGLLGLDHVDAHIAEHGEDVLDLPGIDHFRQRVDLVMGDVAALLGAAHQRLDGRLR
jgi:hypothetical protein